MRRRGFVLRLALVFVLPLAVVASLAAQERFGGMTGIVRDESGAVIPGTTVVITNKTADRALTLVTDGAGSYRVDDLEPGHYTVSFELTGFTRSEIPDVAVLLGRVLRADGTLRVGRVSEAVRVAAGPPPLIDVRKPLVAHNVTEEEFDRLPKTRSFQSLALTAPSVNTGAIEGSWQVNGASSAENTFTIDGVTTGNLYNGRSRQDAAFEYVQEVQVKTTGIPAEYGGAMGGVISAVTRSGGNTVRGEAHHVYEGSAIAAGPKPRLVLSPADDKTVSYVQDAKQPDHRHELGGSLGGPLAKNRLFFFVSASPRLVRSSNAYLFGDGNQSDIAQKQTAVQAFGKISYASSRIRAYGSVLATPVDSVGTLPGYNSTAANGLSSSQAGNAVNLDRGFKTNQTSATGHVDVTLSNAAYVTVRGGYFRDSYKDTGIPNTTSVTYQTSGVGFAAIPPALQAPIGTQNTPRALITSGDNTTQVDVGIEFNRAWSAKGQHTVKAGLGFQRSVSDANAAYPGGYVLLYWDRTFSFGGTSGRGAYGYYEVNDRGFTGTAEGGMTSLFVQDEYRIGSRLTLDLGIRAETEKIPSYRSDLRRYVREFGLGDKIAPRLGASYDVRGDGHIKVYGGWGRYYDWTKYQFSRNAGGADVWKTYYRALDTSDVYSLNLSNMPGADLWMVPGSSRDQAVASLDRVDTSAKPTYQDSVSVGLEHQLGAHTVLTAHYVHNDLKQVLEDIGTVINGNRVLYISNPGEGNASMMATTGRTTPFATPKVTRTYDALELGASRRHSNGWFASANYTYSRLYGNYGGVASADEIRTPTTGGSYLTPQTQDRSIANPGGALRTYWNIDEVMWDSHGRLDLLGRLATDRPHVAKIYGSYSFPFGAQIGLLFYGASGTPISTYVNTANQTEVFVNGRGDMGRTPRVTQTHLLVSHGVSLGGGKKLRVELNVLNLFNQKTAVHLFNYLNRGGGAVPRASSAINLSQIDLAKGYDCNALIRATSDGANAYDPRYGKADLFNDGARAQVMVKLIF